MKRWRELSFLGLCLALFIWITSDISPVMASSTHSPFYGIWLTASKDRSDCEAEVEELQDFGYDADVYETTDWDNLNSEHWYVVSAGEYSSKKSAQSVLSDLKDDGYTDGYVKYTGDWIGAVVSNAVSESMSPFYGVWLTASKDIEDCEKTVTTLEKYGFEVGIYETTDWENLNDEHWYVVSAGEYSSKKIAKQALEELWDVTGSYSDGYVKYTGEWIGDDEDYDPYTTLTTSPFYGVWLTASQDRSDCEKAVDKLWGYGFDAAIYETTDWENLNSKHWYVVSAGEFSSKKVANSVLEEIEDITDYTDGYVKYTGEWKN